MPLKGCRTDICEPRNFHFQSLHCIACLFREKRKDIQMNVCRSCGKTAPLKEQEAEFVISKEICASCRSKIAKADTARDNKKVLDSIDAPVLLMQPDPRQVSAANNKAAELFSKELPGMEGHRGGEVFDCVHAFTEAGCGKDVHCEDCGIKKAVVETFSAGGNSRGVSAELRIRKGDRVAGYVLEVTTEKVGELALLRIDRYERR